METWLQTDNGRRIPFAAACTIGRLPENTVALDDPGVSRRHALIHAHGPSGFWLMDFGSRNGVVLNHCRINEPVRIKEGDNIQIAGHHFTFHERNRTATAKNAPANSAAWKTTESLTETFIPVGHGMILLAPDGRVQSISGLAQKWLRGYFAKTNSDGLPPEISDWLQRQKTRKQSSAGFSREILSIEKDRKRLAVKIAEKSPDQLLLLLTESETIFSAPLLKRLGLTEREGEVLHWLAEGKSNPEIAIILGTSPRTVGKHVEHIYGKLGVQSRTAAMLCVMETLGKV